MKQQQAGLPTVDVRLSESTFDSAATLREAWQQRLRGSQYHCFEALSRNEIEGQSYTRTVIDLGSKVAIVAPHGGNLEPGTAELARVLAGSTRSLYLFESLKPCEDDSLHLTSARFDDRSCLSLIANSELVVTVHGYRRAYREYDMLVGGLAEEYAGALIGVLNEAGIAARRDDIYQGINPQNICNRGRLGQGVQLELSPNLRDEFLEVRGDVLVSANTRVVRMVQALKGFFEKLEQEL